MSDLARAYENTPKEQAGLLLVGCIKPGVALTVRICDHAGVVVTPAGATATTFSFPRGSKALWLGWYSTRILANGWEPYDQPNPVAYMPLGFSRMSKFELARSGLLLRERCVGSVEKLVADGRHFVVGCTAVTLERELRRLLVHAGVDEGESHLASRFLAASDRSADSTAA